MLKVLGLPGARVVPIVRTGRLHLHRKIRLQARAANGASAAQRNDAGESYGENNDSVLVIGVQWPERGSAAGVRTADLIADCLQRGRAVSCAATSAPNSHSELLQQQGVRTFQCPPNREAELCDVLAHRPAYVIFDRFYSEEMFSFRVRQPQLHQGPVRILDMQDCHFLREGRRELVKAGASMAEVLACRPDASSERCLRELAAIHRSDLTLVCSPQELNLLTQHYDVPESKLVLAPFFVPPSPHAAAPGPFHSRQHFFMIGNFLHQPNVDSARWTCDHVWPSLRQRLAAAGICAELHIYGAYAPASADQLHRPKQGIRMKGFAPTLSIMTSYRVCLAPLRFGAGLKGKIVDAWWHGLPVCTTPIGAEGMGADLPAGADEDSCWGGLWRGATAEDVAADAFRLYTDDSLWSQCQRRGFQLLTQLYDRRQRLDAVDAAMVAARQGLEQRRAQDFMQSMLWQQTARSTEYFSRWIELKESLAALPAAADVVAGESLAEVINAAA